MPKFRKYEVRVHEDQTICFEQLMRAHRFGFNDTGEFRVTNLQAWVTGEQKDVVEFKPVSDS